MGLRDQFKPTKTTALKSRIAAEDRIAGSAGNSEYLSIDDGVNKFRIFPAHPSGRKDDPDPFYQMRVMNWVSLEKEDGTMGRRPVPNGKVHAGITDIFDAYIKRIKTYMDENEVEDADAKLAAATNWKGGLTSSATWVCYAYKIGKDGAKEFGLLEMKRSVRDGLNNIATLEEGDEPIEVDPFTDPDTGIPVIIKYNSKAKQAKDYYSVTLGNKPTPMPLADEELSTFEQQKPLIQLYTNAYSQKDLENSIQGIVNWDEEHQVGFCETDEWTELVSQVTSELEANQVGESKKTAGGAKKTAPAKAAPAKRAGIVKHRDLVDEEEATEEEEGEVEEVEEEAVEEEASGDELDGLDRSALKKHIVSNALPVRVTTAMSDDDIREAIRAAAATEEVEDEVEEEEAPPAPKKVVGTKSLSDIKAQLLKKGKK